MSQNQELVVFYIRHKLSQKDYPLNHIGLRQEFNRTDGGEEASGEEQRVPTHPNGTTNGTSPPASPLRESASLDAVKKALQDSANEFEMRYSHAFSDLDQQLHITPATAYQSFENVVDEVFRDDVNWGRIVGLFAFGGALCVECMEKEMSPLVGRIIEWMTVYLDNHLQPWIESQGGWCLSATQTNQLLSGCYGNQLHDSPPAFPHPFFTTWKVSNWDRADFPRGSRTGIMKKHIESITSGHFWLSWKMFRLSSEQALSVHRRDRTGLLLPSDDSSKQS
ncbi:bcl-2-like protein 1 isoform X2 [Phyllopteryx taeniolatus]|uniref:bcl-2-like protein 1 isoform X2 n=1 Tax=Phyllopteryx taeniolatus TaxID=161469 RepID=UPI002AD57B03|nr:bcl-2-like protein 1 isoform X2 [Phyllopteryx taeniolatus]